MYFVYLLGHQITLLVYRATLTPCYQTARFLELLVPTLVPQGFWPMVEIAFITFTTATCSSSVHMLCGNGLLVLFCIPRIFQRHTESCSPPSCPQTAPNNFDAKVICVGVGRRSHGLFFPSMTAPCFCFDTVSSSRRQRCSCSFIALPLQFRLSLSISFRLQTVASC